MGLGGESVMMAEPTEPIDGGENGKGQKVWDDETEQVQYNYRYYIIYGIYTVYNILNIVYFI